MSFEQFKESLGLVLLDSHTEDLMYQAYNAGRDHSKKYKKELGTCPECGDIMEYTGDICDKCLHESDACPECGSRTESKWSGIKCSKCAYWFCF